MKKCCSPGAEVTLRRCLLLVSIPLGAIEARKGSVATSVNMVSIPLGAIEAAALGLDQQKDTRFQFR